MLIRLVNAIVVFVTLFVLLPLQVWGRVVEVRPGEDYRPLLRTLEPGDELVFLPGTHLQHATIRVSGTQERPIVLRGQADAQGRWPEIAWVQQGQNTWEIDGRHVRIRDLGFHSKHHYGIRIREGTNVKIQNCLFRDNGGGDLSVNSGPAVSIHIHDCRFTGGKQTPVYVGNHDGSQRVTDFRFERNVVDGSQILDTNVVGYGVQLKLNVDGVIRNNYISGTQGPAIMVYGFDNPETKGRQLVEKNITIGARQSANIVVGGGPVTVRDNLVLDGRRGCIEVIDYASRDLLDAIDVSGNVLIGHQGHSLRFSRKARGLRAERNLLVTPHDVEEETGLADLFGQASIRNTRGSQELFAAIDQLQRGTFVPSNQTAVHVTSQIESTLTERPEKITELIERLLSSDSRWP